MKQMNSENYVENVLRTDCPITAEVISRVSNPGTVRLLHAAMGLCTESAELLDMLKKHIFYGKTLDLVNAEEEGGDALWYVGLLVDELGKTLSEVMTKNIEKLRLRYPAKFNGVDAINRNVEAERILLEGQAEPSTISQRGCDWLNFSDAVLNHIENYTVPQYGDKGEDQATEYGSAEHMLQVKRYHARFGTGARPGEEFRDLLKMAHYVQMTHDKLKEEKES